MNFRTCFHFDLVDQIKNKCNQIYSKLANRYVSSFNKILFKIVCYFVYNQRFTK